MKIKNQLTGKVIQGVDGLTCPECGSHQTKTVLINTHDTAYLFNDFVLECQECKHRFEVRER